MHRAHPAAPAHKARSLFDKLLGRFSEIISRKVIKEAAVMIAGITRVGKRTDQKVGRDTLQNLQHGVWPGNAIDPDQVGPKSSQLPKSLDHRQARWQPSLLR